VFIFDYLSIPSDIFIIMITARVTKSSLRISFASLRPVTTSNVRQIEDIRQLCLGHNWNTHTSQKQKQYKYQSTLANNDVLGNGSSSISWQHKRRDDDGDDDEADNLKNGNYFTRQLLMLSPQPQQQQLQLQSSQRRMYHTTSSSERAAVLVMGLATLSAVGYAGSSAIKSYNEFKASQPTEEELDEMRRQEEEQQQQNERKQEETAKQQTRSGATTADDDSTQPRQNIFREWFDVGTKYYDGGFEDTMTRREAALILGVRESSSPARVKDAHRNLLIANHPDTGGSTFLAGKLNEAKELLLKGKSQRKKK
jgi:hypothetical protein